LGLLASVYEPRFPADPEVTGFRCQPSDDPIGRHMVALRGIGISAYAASGRRSERRPLPD
jgi:hypothetical protein